MVPQLAAAETYVLVIIELGAQATAMVPQPWAAGTLGDVGRVSLGGVVAAMVPQPVDCGDTSKSTYSIEPSCWPQWCRSFALRRPCPNLFEIEIDKVPQWRRSFGTAETQDLSPVRAGTLRVP